MWRNNISYEETHHSTYAQEQLHGDNKLNRFTWLKQQRGVGKMKYKNFLITEQENTVDNLDAMWYQKQLEEEQQIDQIRERNLFEWQAIQDAIYYSKRLKIADKNK